MFVLIIYASDVVLTLFIMFIVWKLRFAFAHFKMKQLLSGPSMLQQLPSVSVCIPARNEMHAMTQCLERVIASTYPKLEIIVLDDSSADNTSVLIKSFAHAGVRFVEGSSLPDGWLGKNHALQGLLDEASGSYVFYMDVDTIIEPDTIGQLVAYAMQENVAMVSVLPRRMDAWRASILLGTLRYYWELILHRHRAPAVASNAWMIKRHVLINQLGGFEPLKNYIQPEEKLAGMLMMKGVYRFLLGTKALGVSYEKKWLSQIETGIRLLYPLFGGTLPSNTLALAVLVLFNVPVLVLIIGLFGNWSVIQTIALIQLVALMTLFGLYLHKMHSVDWWASTLLWPIVIAQEAVLHVVGIYRNLRHTVTWKGRPVMAQHKQRSVERI